MTLHVAILGGTGHIGKALTAELISDPAVRLQVYVRDMEAMNDHLQKIEAGRGRADVLPIDTFGEGYCDVMINAIGAGDPARLAALGHGIFQLTEDFDNRVLAVLGRNPDGLYLNFSSGAVYGAGFATPPNATSRFELEVNSLPASLHYGLAKLHAEAKHRGHTDLNIVDLRVFSFFSRYIDLNGRFFMADVARCLAEDQTLITNNQDFIRDFVVPLDLGALVRRCIDAWEAKDSAPMNYALDYYSKAPAGKFEIIERLSEEFSLRYRIEISADTVTTTGAKSQYFSNFWKASELGYEPTYTTADGIIRELRSLLDR